MNAVRHMLYSRTFMYTVAVTQRCFLRKMFYEYVDSLQENIHAKVPHGYSSVNMLRTFSRKPFLVKASGEPFLYIALNR